jgi:hypothetical protein
VVPLAPERAPQSRGSCRFTKQIYIELFYHQRIHSSCLCSVKKDGSYHLHLWVRRQRLSRWLRSALHKLLRQASRGCAALCRYPSAISTDNKHCALLSNEVQTVLAARSNIVPWLFTPSTELSNDLAIKGFKANY